MSTMRTRYLRLPAPRPHQVVDVLTSIDEALREVILGLDMVIQYLATITGKTPEQVTPTPRLEVVVPPPPLTVQVTPPAQQRVVSLPYPLDIIGVAEVEVSETEAKRVPLDGDLIVLTSDGDIKFGKRPDSMYPLWMGSYLIMSRSDTLNEIYIRSIAGTARAYVLMLAIR